MTKRKRSPVPPRPAPPNSERAWEATVDGGRTVFYHGVIRRRGRLTILVGSNSRSRNEHAVCLVSEEGTKWYAPYDGSDPNQLVGEDFMSAARRGVEAALRQIAVESVMRA